MLLSFSRHDIDTTLVPAPFHTIPHGIPSLRTWCRLHAAGQHWLPSWTAVCLCSQGWSLTRMASPARHSSCLTVSLPFAPAGAGCMRPVRTGCPSWTVVCIRAVRLLDKPHMPAPFHIAPHGAPSLYTSPAAGWQHWVPIIMDCGVFVQSGFKPYEDDLGSKAYIMSHDVPSLRSCCSQGSSHDTDKP